MIAEIVTTFSGAAFSNGGTCVAVAGVIATAFLVISRRLSPTPDTVIPSEVEGQPQR